MDEMTTAELNQFLENIAKLIEATAKTPEAAAESVRDSKVKAEKVAAATQARRYSPPQGAPGALPRPP